MPHTSLNEVVACLDLALSNNYISESEINAYLLKAENLANQITAFRKKLLNNPTKWNQMLNVTCQMSNVQEGLLL